MIIYIVAQSTEHSTAQHSTVHCLTGNIYLPTWHLSLCHSGGCAHNTTSFPDIAASQASQPSFRQSMRPDDGPPSECLMKGLNGGLNLRLHRPKRQEAGEPSRSVILRKYYARRMYYVYHSMYQQ